MTNSEIVKQYIPLVQFLGEALGPSCEVVLHDMQNLDNSVIAISHGELSGRQVGDSATNLLLRVLRTSKSSPFMTNYSAKASEGKEFRSSTYFICNSKGNKIGALCINLETSRYKALYDELDGLFGFSCQKDTRNEPYVETFTKSSQDTIRMLVNDALSRCIVQVEAMTMDDKLALVDDLVKQGVFLYKGSVPLVAELLKVSEPTVYRYIAKVRNTMQKS